MNDNNNTEQFRRDNMCHHSTKTEKELYRLCPAKLTKRELEDLYFTLVENNIELKQTVNNQRETMKVLNTKVQRMAAAQKASMGKEQKDCCASTKAVISEQKDSIAELKKANERMSERIRLLNMRLCSAKQFLKCASPYKKVSLGVTTTKISSTSALSARKTEPAVGAPGAISVSFQCLEGAASSARSKTVSTRTEPTSAEYEAPVPEQSKLCDENKCRTQMDELKQKIVNLQEELSRTHSEYSARIARLEADVRRLRGEAGALAGRAARLRDVEAQCSDKSGQLAVERRRVSELEMRLRLADAHAHEIKADSLNELCHRSTTCRTDSQPALAPLEAVSAAGETGVKGEAGEAKRAGPEAEPRSGDDSGYTEQPGAAADQETTKLLEKISELRAQLEAVKNTAGETAPEAKPREVTEFKSYDVEVPAGAVPAVGSARARRVLVVDPRRKLVVELEQPPLQAAEGQAREAADESTAGITPAEAGPGRGTRLARDASRQWDDGVILYKPRESDETPEPVQSDKQLQRKIDEINEKHHRTMDDYDQTPASPADSSDPRKAGHKKRTIQIKQPTKSPTNRTISISTQVEVNSTQTECDPEPSGSDGGDRLEPSVSDGRDRREPSGSDERNRSNPSSYDGRDRWAPSSSDERNRSNPSSFNGRDRWVPSGFDGRDRWAPSGSDGRDRRKPSGSDGTDRREPSGSDERDRREPSGSDGRARSDEGKSSSCALKQRRATSSTSLQVNRGPASPVDPSAQVIVDDGKPDEDHRLVSQDSNITEEKRQSPQSESEKSDKRPQSDAAIHNKPSKLSKQQQKTPQPDLRLHSLERMAENRRPLSLAEAAVRTPPGSARSQRTYVLRGPGEAASPPASAARPASPACPASPDTDREISSLTDLPTERDSPRSGRGALSPGEDRPATTTSTCSEWCSQCAPPGECDALSDGELPGAGKRLVSSPGQTHVEERWPAGVKGEEITQSTSQRMESALQAISSELERCRRLLQRAQRTQRPSEQRRRAAASLARPGSGASIALRGAPARRRLGAGCAPRARFTLHVGTLVLSDEAVLGSRGLRLVLAWQFYDRSAAMVRLSAARVVHFDFSTEYELDLTEEFFNYIKYEELPLLLSEPGGQERPFASGALPLRDALRHANRRVDMSLALVAGPRLRGARGAAAVLDLWCLLRVHCCGPPPPPPPGAGAGAEQSAHKPVPPVLREHVAKDTQSELPENLHTEEAAGVNKPTHDENNQAYAKSESDAAPKQDFYIPHVHGRNTERRSLDASTPRKDSYTSSHNLGVGVVESMQTFSAAYKVDSDLKGGVSSTHNDTPKENKYKPMLAGLGVNVSQESEDKELFQSRHTINRLRSTALPKESCAGSTLYSYDEVMHKNMIGLDENSLTLVQPTGIITNEITTKIKCADEMKQMCSGSLDQNDNTSMKNVAVGRQFLGEMKRGSSFNSKTTEANSMHELLESENWRKMTKFSPEEGEAEATAKRETMKKVTIRSKYMYPKSPHEFVDGSSDIDLSDLNKTVAITILWLALNEECDAMLDPKVQRLFVAYSFLGREGADLETPVSLPKPKQYVDKCYFYFKKTFQLSESDLAALGHMARCRAPAAGPPNPKDCIVFSVVSEPPEDPLGLDNCEDIGYAHLYLGDLLAYSDGDTYTEVVAVRAARAGGAVCGGLAVRVDGLAVVRRCSVLAHPQLM